MNEVPSRWYGFQLHRVELAPDVVVREFAEEVVLLNVRTGQYHSVDRIGGRFLGAMQDEPDVATACRRLATEFGQPQDVIRADFLAFSDELVERELIRFSPPST